MCVLVIYVVMGGFLCVKSAIQRLQMHYTFGARIHTVGTVMRRNVEMSYERYEYHSTDPQVSTGPAYYVIDHYPPKYILRIYDSFCQNALYEKVSTNGKWLVQLVKWMEGKPQPESQEEAVALFSGAIREIPEP